jgi:molybdopterin synthase sulfur carrier subunit
MARVLFFGRLRDIAGESMAEHDADRLSTLRARLRSTNPALGEAIDSPSVNVAVDKQIRRDDAALTKTSEVAFMPPFSGG